MIELGDIALLRPYWLLAPLFIGALAYVLNKRKGSIGNWEAIINPELLQAMRILGRVDKAKSNTIGWLPFLAAGLIGLALSGPAIEKRSALSFRNLNGAVFVIDVSDSMTEDELWPQVVTMGRVGVSTLGSKPAAMIVYAGDAYVASAITADNAQIGMTMSLLDEKTVPDKGSRPALGLDEARQILEETEIIAGDVLLYTDGAGVDPATMAAAKKIADAGARLSVIYAPTTKSKELPEAFEKVTSLASVGGGRVYNLNETYALKDDLSRNVAQRLEKQDYQLLFWADYGRYLLILALFPVFALFRRVRV